MRNDAPFQVILPSPLSVPLTHLSMVHRLVPSIPPRLTSSSSPLPPNFRPLRHPRRPSPNRHRRINWHPIGSVCVPSGFQHWTSMVFSVFFSFFSLYFGFYRFFLSCFFLVFLCIFTHFPTFLLVFSFLSFS